MDELETILNFIPVFPWLGTAGQPTEGQFGAVARAGYQVVINLALPDSPDALPDEAGLAHRLGLEYIPIPVVWEQPTLEDLSSFFTALESNRGRKIFVHCAKNMRVSAFVYLYRVIRLGEPSEVARQTMELVWLPNPVWENYLQDMLAAGAFW